MSLPIKCRSGKPFWLWNDVLALTVPSRDRNLVFRFFARGHTDECYPEPDIMVRAHRTCRVQKRDNSLDIRVDTRQLRRPLRGQRLTIDQSHGAVFVQGRNNIPQAESSAERDIVVQLRAQ